MNQALLRFARQVVASVQSQLMQQLNIVEEQAHNPMRQMIQQVIGGVWVGEGANAFVNEVSALAIPHVINVRQNIHMTNTNLQRATDIIDRADEQVTTLANSVGDQFASIY